jgi:UDP-GlcNAc:undecaprenyl-phosphate/decaprenyl-phosphate GlcNAc-1-phosphate transferase
VTGTVFDVAIAGGLGFVLVAFLTEVMRRIAIRRRGVVQPPAARGDPIAPPQLGGVAIAAGTVSAAVGAAHLGGSRVLAVLLAGVAVSVLGLIDDLRRLSQGVRLVTEALAATGLACAGVHLNVFAGAGPAGVLADGVFTVTWIVVITNSFNLLDNSDGAAAAIAFAGAPVLAVVALAGGRQHAAALLVALAGGCAGFLVHNWPPAQIFMGDAGSLFLGFVISSAAVLICDTGGSSGTPAVTVAAALLLLTFVPVADTCTVLLSRKRAGCRWNQGGTDHLAHRLRAMGLRTSHAAIVLSSTAAASAALGSLAMTGALPARALLVGTVAAGATIVTLAQRVAVRRPPAVPAPAGELAVVPAPAQEPAPVAQDRAAVS